MPTLKPRRTHKADQVLAQKRLARNKLWERVYPRSAARAALDFTGTEYLSPNTCQP
ncbi:hypothetical protein [Pseudomonas sp. NPDC089406]|uniref:hypothetical protein n=1 Tax=Pseudomonas sp. NPDC089406 TaxID=3364463 RepID=UPI00384A65BC